MIDDKLYRFLRHRLFRPVEKAVDAERSDKQQLLDETLWHTREKSWRHWNTIRSRIGGDMRPRTAIFYNRDRDWETAIF